VNAVELFFKGIAGWLGHRGASWTRECAEHLGGLFCGICNRNPLSADTIAIAWLIDQNVVACLWIGVNGYYREDGTSSEYEF
jgi:hypothetical protein